MPPPRRAAKGGRVSQKFKVGRRLWRRVGREWVEMQVVGVSTNIGLISGGPSNVWAHPVDKPGEAEMWPGLVVKTWRMTKPKATARERGVTHSLLVELARKWLSSRGCVVIVTEPRAGWRNETGESPDLLGWEADGTCWVLEVKTSRSDYLADKLKPWRQAGVGLGNRRCYVCPQGLLKAEELPFGWGLVELPAEASDYRAARLSQAHHGQAFDHNERESLIFLLSACRRLGSRDSRVVCTAYRVPNKGATTVTTEDEP